MTTPNITVNIFNYGEAPDVDRVVSRIAEAVAPEAETIPRIVPVYSDKMADGARRALWAAWHDVFDADDVDVRAQFTRTALGLTWDHDVSWSRSGSLTNDQAYHLIRLLNVTREIQSL
jgi:hypothetical protein